MFKNIHADILRYHKCTLPLRKKDVLRLILLNHGLQALIAYRMGRWIRLVCNYYSRWCPLVLIFMPLYWLLTIYVRLAYDIYLYQSAYIGPGLYIGHFAGIRMRNCSIGEHCAIQQEVCLEPTITGKHGPEIGDRVWIGAHARIQGNIHVGNRATIGAGTIITQDIPEGCLFLGNPSRLVLRNYDNSSFL